MAGRWMNSSGSGAGFRRLCVKRVLRCGMEKELELTRLIADLQARAIAHHHILMQLVRREARASKDARGYLSSLTDDLTRIVDQSVPLEDTRFAAMSMRQYFDEFLVTAGMDDHGPSAK